MSTTDNTILGTGTPVTAPPVGGVRRSQAGWSLLAALSVTQTIGYGVMYYAFSVLLSHMVNDLRTSPAAVTTALALAAVVAAAFAVPIGRWLDRRGGRALMTTGSILGCVAVFGWSRVHTVAQLYLVFAVIGLAMAMVLYEPAFAVVVRHTSPARRSTALLTVTIVAGFASSIFLPLTGALVHWSNWRQALLVLACLLATTVPLHAFFIPARARHSLVVAVVPAAHARRAAMRDRGFWLLVVAFSAHGAAVAVIGVHLVTYLTTLGHAATFAATVAGLLGILSVTGRLVSTRLSRRWSTSAVTAAVFVLQATAALLLPVVGRSDLGAIVCVIGVGIGFGVSTIARPALLADRYGTTGYASIAGILALPATLARAGAPVAAALIVGTSGSYTLVMASVAITCMAAAVLLSVLAIFMPSVRPESSR